VKAAAVLMTQTANQEARSDFETAVMQAIVGPSAAAAETH
jgi:hypothetical protein